MLRTLFIAIFLVSGLGLANIARAIEANTPARICELWHARILLTEAEARATSKGLWSRYWRRVGNFTQSPQSLEADEKREGAHFRAPSQPSTLRTSI